MKMFEVGGCVRDEILGVRSKDIDFSVVLDPSEITPRRAKSGKMIERTAFECMEDELRRRGFDLIDNARKPEHLTARGFFPDYSRAHLAVVGNRKYSKMAADFVLARKESGYTDGRRPDMVEPGTLMDDLARRDFTMNAIAKDAEGNFIDPFNGQHDIAARLIRTVGDPFERLSEDALRAVRALRFSVTKKFIIGGETAFAMENEAVLDSIVNKISDERIDAELSKMFRFDTMRSLRIIQQFPLLTEAMFAGKVSLDSTLKTKGRGKK